MNHFYENNTAISKKKKHCMEEMVLFKWILFGRIIVNLLGAWSPRYLLGKSLKEERHLLHEQEQIHNSPLLAPNYSLSEVQEYASGTKGKALFFSVVIPAVPME